MAEAYREFACDLCGTAEALEIPHSRAYTSGEPIHVCSRCGFVYVKRRRSAQRIAEVWSQDIFGADYTATIPAVRARLTYVAEFLHQTVNLAGKTVCDIGAGEGEFLDMVRGPRYGASVFGIEASAKNCARLGRFGIEHYNGTIEDYGRAGTARPQQFDVVTIMWTLENCESCRAMLAGAYRIVKEGGVLLVATGSRILVPFKKPLHDYLSKNPADTHAFRFSANTLRGLLAVSAFEVSHVNRYVDYDVLCMIARKQPQGASIAWQGDDPREVCDFFERWHQETQAHYPLEAAAASR